MAVVAPEVPAAGLFVVGLLAAMVALSLVLLRFGAVTIVGGLLRWLAGIVSWVPFVGHLTEDGVNAGINYVDKQLGDAVAASVGLAVSMLHDSWKLTVWVGDTIADLAMSTEHAVTTIVTSTIPTAVHNVTHPIAADLARIEARIGSVEREAVRELEASIAGLEKRAGQLERKLERELAAGEAAVAGTLGREIAQVEREALHGIDALRDKLTHRLSRVEKLLGIGALTGVVVNVIARHFPWIRCGNVGKVGKHLCGMPVNQLEGLLAQVAIDGLAIVGTVSLLDFAEAMQAVVGEVADETQHFWRAA